MIETRVTEGGRELVDDDGVRLAFAACDEESAASATRAELQLMLEAETEWGFEVLGESSDESELVCNSAEHLEIELSLIEDTQAILSAFVEEADANQLAEVSTALEAFDEAVEQGAWEDAEQIAEAIAESLGRLDEFLPYKKKTIGQRTRALKARRTGITSAIRSGSKTKSEVMRANKLRRRQWRTDASKRRKAKRTKVRHSRFAARRRPLSIAAEDLDEVDFHRTVVIGDPPRVAARRRAERTMKRAGEVYDKHKKATPKQVELIMKLLKKRKWDPSQITVLGLTPKHRKALHKMPKPPDREHVSMLIRRDAEGLIDDLQVMVEGTLDEVSPPGFEGTVKALKKHKGVDNPYALAWYMKNKGYTSHRKKDGSPKDESYDDADVAIALEEWNEIPRGVREEVCEVFDDLAAIFVVEGLSEARDPADTAHMLLQNAADGKLAKELKGDLDKITKRAQDLWKQQKGLEKAGAGRTGTVALLSKLVQDLSGYARKLSSMVSMATKVVSEDDESDGSELVADETYFDIEGETLFQGGEVSEYYASCVAAGQDEGTARESVEHVYGVTCEDVDGEVRFCLDEAGSKEQKAFSALFKKELGGRDLGKMGDAETKKLFATVKAKWAPHSANSPEESADVDEAISPKAAAIKFLGSKIGAANPEVQKAISIAFGANAHRGGAGEMAMANVLKMHFAKDPAAKAILKGLSESGTDGDDVDEHTEYMEDITVGTSVTIIDSAGKERTGKAVMFGHGGWVLNFKVNGYPATASVHNITKIDGKRVIGYKHPGKLKEAAGV